MDCWKAFFSFLCTISNGFGEINFSFCVSFFEAIQNRFGEINGRFFTLLLPWRLRNKKNSFIN
jgi:hypothetical protein